jgi:hypothetical protein
MVQLGDYKIELVSAESKGPFIEHTKDGKIYVEVEPDVDYFISMQQTGTGRGGVTVSEIFVDDQGLGYSYHSLQRMDEPVYCGLWTRLNNVCKCIPYQ